MEQYLAWIVIAACAVLFFKFTKNVLKTVIAIVIIAAIIIYGLPMLGVG